MKEDRIDVGDGLTIDLAPHKKLGMNIISKEWVSCRKELYKKVVDTKNIRR